MTWKTHDSVWFNHRSNNNAANITFYRVILLKSIAAIHDRISRLEP